MSHKKIKQTVVEVRPQPKQEMFLASPADICIFGGGLGAVSKSFAILVDPVRHVENKDFGGVIFRRTSPQITNEGGLWYESARIYPVAGARLFFLAPVIFLVLQIA